MDANENKLKTPLCKAKCPTSLKSISVYVYISTGVGRCVCASGLGINL